jgi:hypothetical protein
VIYVHRYWDGRPEPVHAWTAQVIRSLHAGTKFVEWTPETLPVPGQDLIGSGDVRHDSNLVRYFLLERYGGLWLDHDVIPLRTLVGAEYAWTAGVGRRYEGSTMWFPRPGHPVLRQLLTAGQTRTGPSPRRSGARLLGEVLRSTDVRCESRVLPFDAAGRPTQGLREPWAVHLWMSTSSSTAVDSSI